MRLISHRRFFQVTGSTLSTLRFSQRWDRHNLDSGDKQQALKYLVELALPLRQQVGDKVGEVTTLNNIGLVYNTIGNKQQALKYFKQSLSLAQQIDYKMAEGSTLSNIGKVYEALGDKPQALNFLNQSLRLTRLVGDKAQQATTLSNIASVERDRGNLQQALTPIQAAINIIEDLRTKVVNQELRTSYFASQQSIYQFYIDLLMQLHKKDPSKGYDALSLHINERARARNLLELLAEANVDIRQGVDSKLVELVTLSACKTGLGKNVQGEGLVGLTRGFMYAGAKRVVVSLWSVNDLTTASVMEKFYRKMLGERQNPVAAMRAAQLDTWKSGKAPYYWAAFTIQGEWQ